MIRHRSNEDKLDSSYIFGTLHGWNEKIEQKTNTVLSYLYSSERFLAEIDLNRSSPQVIMPYIKLPEEYTLDHLLGPKKIERMREILYKFFGMELNQYKEYTPLFVLMQIQMSLLGNSGQSVDNFLWGAAENRGLSCGGAEDLYEHFEVFKAIDLDQQCKMLNAFLRNVSNEKKRLFLLENRYIDENIEGIYRHVRGGLGKCKHTILDQRNKKIVSTLCKEMGLGKKVFAAVGASHLWGKYGILALLKRNNLLVKPIYLNDRI